MKIKVRYFGRFAIALGIYSEVIDVEENLKVRELVELLKQLHPELKNEIMEISIDGKYAPDDMEVHGEIAIYPPISGG